MDSNWVHGLTGKFHNHRPYSKRAGAKGNPFVGRPSTSIPRLQIQRPIPNLSQTTVPPSVPSSLPSTVPPLPQLTVRKNLIKKPTLKKVLPMPKDLRPALPTMNSLDNDDSLSNQLVSFLNPDIEIKSEPNSDLDADYLD